MSRKKDSRPVSKKEAEEAALSAARLELAKEGITAEIFPSSCQGSGCSWTFYLFANLPEGGRIDLTVDIPNQGKKPKVSHKRTA